MSAPVSKKSQLSREFIVKELRTRLVGPFAVDELLFNRAYDTYHTGFLAPSETLIEPEEDDLDAADTDPDTGAAESLMTLANLSQQSAMGMSFQIAPDSISAICLTARWGEYIPVEASFNGNETAENADNNTIPTTTETTTDNSNDSAPAARTMFKWQRKQCERVLFLEYSNTATKTYIKEGIELRVIDRMQAEARIVTFSIINRRAQATFPNDNRIYQVELSAETKDGSPAFVARPPSTKVFDDEFWTYELLYRDHKELAIGHGCSVEWDSENGKCATKIKTNWIPGVEVPKASADVLVDSDFLRLDFLCDEFNRNNVLARLEQLAAKYQEWIVNVQSTKESVVGEFSITHQESIRKACDNNIQQCHVAASRIRQGIEFLKNDAVWKAFCLANNAMAKSMRKARPDKQPTWRAFQLAFILVCLPSALDPEDADRGNLDLIWFPTGGGKTEAYLGLAAIVIFHRRITAQNTSEAAGTTVLTRYTLRLLTIQQFERAAKMICACELIRKDAAHKLPAIPITCGLFVGNSATPGSLQEAKCVLSGEISDEATLTTLPLVKCPWCGEKLQKDMQRISDGRLITPCPNQSCEFHAEIPIAVVDEELFNHPATMVVGTIDKFARMAWEPRIRHIFGGDSNCPPSLIIQDELHLISDSLGTLAALYETAIDQLCSKASRGPKIIGSTATIRRAEQQCLSLFARKSVQFPPSGLIAADSFFYRNESLEAQPGRLYIGVHAQGRSPKHSLVWTVGTLAQSVMPATITDDKIRDSFYTQVLYFNSLRELGGALVLAEDDIPRFLKSIIPEGGPKRRRLDQMKELTGQVPSSQIPEMMAHLQRSLYDGDLNYEPLDLVFSTNMISVGIDVDRLGIMVVNGQPKTTSEYIQATSRVGRPAGSAGLVVTLYNWTRPRDRSHYERFTTYHNSFYRYVESVSVTPFSARARDRALHAVLVSLSRLMIPSLSAKESAYHIGHDIDAQRKVRDIARLIVQRAQNVDTSEADATRKDLDRLIEEWIEESEQYQSSLHWSKHPKQPRQWAMLRNPDSDKFIHGLWKTPHSMRDVQSPAPVRILTKQQIQDIN